MDKKLNKWKKIASLHNYSVKFCKGRNIIKIYITNCIDIWAEELSEECFTKRCEESGVSGTVSSFLEELFAIIDSSEETHDFTFQESSKNLAVLTLWKSIELTTTSKAKITIKFKMEKLPELEFYHHVTLPVTAACWQYQKQNNELIELLLKKDAEIAEYKANNNINVARRNMITKPFDRKVFVEQNNVFTVPEDIFLDPASSLDSLQDYNLLWQRMTDLKIVKPVSTLEETPVIKTELDDVTPHKRTKMVKQEKFPQGPLPPVHLRKSKRIL